MATDQVSRGKWVQKIRQQKEFEFHLRDIVDATLAEDDEQRSRKFRSRRLSPLQRSVLEQLLVIMKDLERESDAVSRAKPTSADTVASEFLDEVIHEWLLNQDDFLFRSDKVAARLHKAMREGKMSLHESRQGKIAADATEALLRAIGRVLRGLEVQHGGPLQEDLFLDRLEVELRKLELDSERTQLVFLLARAFEAWMLEAEP